MAEDQKRPEGIISFEAGKAIRLGEVESPETRKLRPWRPKMPLKELVEKSDDPRLMIYKRLLKVWPNISNARFSEIVQEVDRDRLEKVLYLHEKTGRIFEEFLASDLSIEETRILDAVYRYYHLLERAEKEGILDLIKKCNSLDHRVTIDGHKFKAKLYAILDSKPVKLDYYPDEFGKPVIGLPYTSWPCFNDFKLKAKQEAERIAQNILTGQIDPIEIDQLNEIYQKILSLERDFLRLNISMFIQFPVKYSAKKGLLGGHIYLNRIRYPCGLCGKGHDLWLIAEVK